VSFGNGRYVLREVPSHQHRYFVRELQEERPGRGGGAPNERVRPMDVFAMHACNPELAWAMDFGADVESWEEGDSHPYHHHLSQRVETCPFVVA
jgi:hypothetical protein